MLVSSVPVFDPTKEKQPLSMSKGERCDNDLDFSPMLSDLRRDIGLLFHTHCNGRDPLSITWYSPEELWFLKLSKRTTAFAITAPGILQF